MIVYKVTRPNGTSAIVSIPGLSVRYSINKTTFPLLAHSKLMAFDFLDSAKEWGERLYYYPFRPLIFKCAAKNVVPYHNFLTSDMFSVVDFWREFSEYKAPKVINHNTYHKAPYGTVFCDAITPLELVEGYNDCIIQNFFTSSCSS